MWRENGGFTAVSTQRDPHSPRHAWAFPESAGNVVELTQAHNQQVVSLNPLLCLRSSVNLPELVTCPLDSWCQTNLFLTPTLGNLAAQG